MNSQFRKLTRVVGAHLLAAALFLVGTGLTFADEFPRIGFDELAARTYEPTPPEGSKKKVTRKDPDYLERYVPESVLALNGKAVEIAGYMLPLTVNDKYKVEEFLLLPDTGGCCYGVMPASNGFVYARAKKGVNLLDNIPIRIRGKLKVEEVWQEGFFSHLYFVEVEDVALGMGFQPTELP